MKENLSGDFPTSARRRLPAPHQSSWAGRSCSPEGRSELKAKVELDLPTLKTDPDIGRCEFNFSNPQPNENSTFAEAFQGLIKLPVHTLTCCGGGLAVL